MKLLDVRVVTPAAVEVVTVQEFIDHARINGITVDRQPELIARELAAATRRCELFLRRSLLEQTLAALFAPDCTGLLVLPRGPVKSVTSVTSDGQAVAGYSLQWNVMILGTPLANAAEVVYVSAGYGAAAQDVPADIREGILEYATVLYEERSGGREAKYQASAGRTIPAGVVDLWRPEQIEVGG